MVKHLWRFALVLFLVPVVVFSTPTMANALPPAQGPTVGAAFRFDGIGPGDVPLDGADCSGAFSFRRDSLGQQIIRASAGFCRGDVDHSPWTCQLFEPNCTQYRFTFEGTNCSGLILNPATRTMTEDSFLNIHSGWVTIESVAGTCDPSSVCLTASNSGGWGADESSQDCYVIALDPILLAAEPTSTCPTGTMSRPRFDTAPINKAASWDPSSFYWFQTVQFGLSGITPGDTYTGYVVYSDHANSPGVDMTGETLGVQLALEWFGLTPGEGPREQLLQSGGSFAAGMGTPASPYVQIRGMGYIRNSVDAGGGNWELNANALKLPQVDATNGLIGVTDPLRCSSYWGLKVANIAANTKDEPIAALAAAPAPLTDPAPVNPGTPEADPPPASESGFWSAILNVLRQIYNAILGVIKAVSGLVLGGVGFGLDALLGGITALFVPDSVDMMDDVELTKDAWSETSLSTWTSTMTGQAFSMPSSGCNGIPVVFDLPGGVPVDMHLGAACSGPLAGTAGIVKAISTGAIIIFGGFACLRALGSGFGWNPSVATKGTA